MSEKAFSRDQIPRGADLTDDDLSVIASDMLIVFDWAKRNWHKQSETEHRFLEALRARLGRRPLVIAPPVGQAR